MGEVFAGRYELLDPVAEGGMGTVWCILDRSDGQMKAAKILRQSDAATLLRFVREQSMRIAHDHVVTPQSWAGMDDRVLFTMPLMRGGSVSGLLKQYGALPLSWVSLLTDQMLQALEAVHAAEIVHRDIKPANLLLEPTGPAMPHLRLTDFGIAAPLDEPRMTKASMVIGSPGYMAPEQWRGGDPDFRSDLYSAARVSLEMLTGERPSTETSGVDLSGLRTGEPRFDGFLDLLTEACNEDPVKRPGTAGEMRERLLSFDLASLPGADGGRQIHIADHFADVVVPDAPAPVAEDAVTRMQSAGTAVLGGTGAGNTAGAPTGHAAFAGPSPAQAGPAQAVSAQAVSAQGPSAVSSVALIGGGVLALVAALLLLIL